MTTPAWAQLLFSLPRHHSLMSLLLSQISSSPNQKEKHQTMALVLIANTDQTLTQQQNPTGRIPLVRRIYDAQAAYQGPAPDPVSPHLHHTLGCHRNVHPELFTEFSSSTFSCADFSNSLKTARYPNNLQTCQVLDPFLRWFWGALCLLGESRQGVASCRTKS